MSFSKNLTILFPLLFTLLTSFTNAATFVVLNNCPYTVWAAASSGGGMCLHPGQSWTVNVIPGTNGGRMWGRTNCSFDANGNGQCETSDCNGLLQCQSYGKAPNTLAEFELNLTNNLDFFYISNASPTFGGCTRVIKCNADIKGECPIELQAPGGCNNPCTVFQAGVYCCNSLANCSATYLATFFKIRCPDAYIYPKDDPTSLFTCPGGTNYEVVFCPQSSESFLLELRPCNKEHCQSCPTGVGRITPASSGAAKLPFSIAPGGDHLVAIQGYVYSL
ncbi:hypothetical protein HYC85_020945 [Camellia sinensis]|uniref:Thaumatin-like protein n=1 Tax=Camellia sinensis TaxID=4442 RepID=A0A7J7GRA1_CAMSI|nr:hypothetical protein HYC85_020945 [Camellia sinensis]